MKTTTKFTYYALLASILSVFAMSGGAFAAGFDPKVYAVEDDGLLFKTVAGKKTQVEGAEVVAEAIEGGRIYWLNGDPEAVGTSTGLYTGWKAGMYFFGNDGKFISCLEGEEAAQGYVKFSPDGKLFVLGTGTYVDHTYTLYTFAGFEKKKTFYGLAGLEWLDSNRFACSLIDTAKKARSANADIDGWFSLVVYDVAADALTTLAEATATSDFMLFDVDKESGTLSVTKISVTNEKDWGDEAKRTSEQISVPIPAAKRNKSALPDGI